MNANLYCFYGFSKFLTFFKGLKIGLMIWA